MIENESNMWLKNSLDMLPSLQEPIYKYTQETLRSGQWTPELNTQCPETSWFEGAHNAQCVNSDPFSLPSKSMCFFLIPDSREPIESS